MIIRRRHTANFTTIGNALFNDERLALDELGLLAWLRSRPGDWEVRRPALMRRFKIGRDGMRRIMRSLLRYGWMMAQVTRLSDGRVHVIYEVRDEPGPELSEDEARSALSLVSSGAGFGESTDDDGEGDASEPEVDGADPPSAYGSPPTGQPEAASRLRPSPPGPIEDSLKTDSVKTESPNGVRMFADVKQGWPAEHALSVVTAERAYLGLTDNDKIGCADGMKPYLADCASQGRKVCDLRTYIEEKRWERFKAKDPSSKPFALRPGIPQTWRWREYYERAEPAKLWLFDKMLSDRGTYTVPSEWPPPLPPKASTGPPPVKQLSEEDIRDFK